MSRRLHKRVLVLVLGIAVMATYGCASTQEDPAPSNFAVTASIDGEPFDENKPIQFAALAPGQTQTKSIVITNTGDTPGLIDEIGIEKSGSLFEKNLATITIVGFDGKELQPQTIAVSQTIEGKIVLVTDSALGLGETGAIKLNFRASQAK